MGKSSSRDGREEGHGFAVVQALILVGVPTVDEDDGDLGWGDTDPFDEITHIRAVFQLDSVLIVGVLSKAREKPNLDFHTKHSSWAGWLSNDFGRHANYTTKAATMCKRPGETMGMILAPLSLVLVVEIRQSHDSLIYSGTAHEFIGY